MADRDGIIWYDGEPVQWRDVAMHVLAHTLHYGMGVFKDVCAYDIPRGTTIFRLQAHIDRPFDSTHIMNIQILYGRDEINEAARAAARENNLKSAYIHPTVFYGSEGMGLRVGDLKVHVIIAAWSQGVYMDEEALQQGIKTCTNSFTRHHINISMIHARPNGTYINSTLALQETISDGAGEAVMLDPESYVAEGSDGSILIIKDGVIHILEVIACLNGVTRNTILALTAERGFKLVEKRITRDEVYVADEAFFTSTAAEVTSAYEIDGHKIGAGRRGPAAEKLQKVYFDLVSDKTRIHAEWCTLVK